MKLETFFEKFDQFAEAPTAVAKLRELVLQLAIQGKLVDQEQDDEPAAKLLQRLIAFKSANPLAGRSGRSKEESAESEAASELLPANWVNTTIGEVLYVIRGASPRPKGDPQYFSDTRTPYHWVKISDIRKHGQNGLLMDTDEFLTEAGMRKSVLLPKGTLILTNSATIGVPIVLGIDGCCIHDGYLAFPNFPYALLNQKFLLYLFHTLKRHAEQNARGLAQLNLNTALVRSFPFGLPPLAEQKRIVAKVDELMALCDRLETQQQERDTRRAALSRASLVHFSDAPTPENLNHLFRPSYAIDPADIRKTILNLAVQGKLVPQDVNDKPAESLNDRILLSLKTIAERVGARFTKPSALIESRDDLPAGWGVAPLQSVGITQTGTTPSKSEPSFEGNHIPFIKPGDIKGDVIDYENEGLSIDGLRAGRLIPLDSILMVSIGGSIGKTALVDRDVSCNQQINSVTPAECIAPRFILAAIRSQDFQNEVINRAAQCTLPIISKSKWETIRVPIPPLAEQRRIVAKVDQLMTLVDQLETLLAASRTAAVNLMEAVVAQLTAQE